MEVCGPCAYADDFFHAHLPHISTFTWDPTYAIFLKKQRVPGYQILHDRGHTYIDYLGLGNWKAGPKNVIFDSEMAKKIKYQVCDFFTNKHRHIENLLHQILNLAFLYGDQKITEWITALTVPIYLASHICPCLLQLQFVLYDIWAHLVTQNNFCSFSPGEIPMTKLICRLFSQHDPSPNNLNHWTQSDRIRHSSEKRRITSVLCRRVCQSHLNGSTIRAARLCMEVRCNTTWFDANWFF